MEPELKAADLHAVATLLGFSYAGTGLETMGQQISLQCTVTEVPYFPSSLPVRKRKTYWRWECSPGKQDIIVASLDELLTTILCVAPSTVELTLTSAEDILNRLRGETLDEGNASRKLWLERVRTFLLPQDPMIWSARPSACARPCLLTDYQRLASQMRLCFLGVKYKDGRFIRLGLPDSIFASTALFQVIAEGHQIGTVGNEVHSSYWELHKMLLRRQPTHHSVRLEFFRLLEESGTVPTELQLRDAFPWCSGTLVDCMYSEVQDSLTVEEYNSGWFAARIADSFRVMNEQDIAEIDSLPGLPADLTPRIQFLMQENFRDGVADLTRAQPSGGVSLRDGNRRGVPLTSHTLLPSVQRGMRVASNRGLRLLIHFYQQEILARFKELRRQSQVADGSLPGTNEDLELERYYEHLPLSPLLMKHLTKFADLMDANVQATLWSEMERCAASVAQWGLGDKATLQLSAHEEHLGAALALLKHHDLLNAETPNLLQTRLRGKNKPQQSMQACRILSVCSLAAWLEMVERWHGGVPTDVIPTGDPFLA